MKIFGSWGSVPGFRKLFKRRMRSDLNQRPKGHYDLVWLTLQSTVGVSSLHDFCRLERMQPPGVSTIHPAVLFEDGISLNNSVSDARHISGEKVNQIYLCHLNELITGLYYP